MVRGGLRADSIVPDLHILALYTWELQPLVKSTFHFVMFA